MSTPARLARSLLPRIAPAPPLGSLGVNGPPKEEKKAPLPPLLEHAAAQLLATEPKQIALSGPAGFLGSRTVKRILQVHDLRRAHGKDPGELVLLSASPGRLMAGLTAQYGREKLETVRATRVDYYTQHEEDLWLDHLGSLGLGGQQSAFVNLAAIAGPVPGRPEAMMAVNYKAPLAAARACEFLDFGHFIQSSTQAVKTERGGQVPYSRWKGMADFSLARLDTLPVSVLYLGLLYCRNQRIVGQKGDTLNLVDMATLPLTPIMGDGSAPLQPLEVYDAAERLAFLALSNAESRPVQPLDQMGRVSKFDDPWTSISAHRKKTLRVYDAVGPETMSMLEMLKQFARINGNKNFRPVFVDYRNLERVLNVGSLGNLNRQFVSLLRSEQDGLRHQAVVGHPEVFSRLLGPKAELYKLGSLTCEGRRRYFPWQPLFNWVLHHPRAILPGIAVNFEILIKFLIGSKVVDRISTSSMWQRLKASAATLYITALSLGGLQLGSMVALSSNLL